MSINFQNSNHITNNLGSFPDENMPSCVDDVIRCFQKSLSNTFPPEVISVNTRHDAKEGDCFNSVKKQIEENGGTICFGWRVILLPQIYIYGEFHAVWANPMGTLIDVSPVVPKDQKYVIFIRDKNLKYSGKRIHNKCAILWNVPEVKAYLRTITRIGYLDDAIADACNKGVLPEKLIEQKEDLRKDLVKNWESLRRAWNGYICSFKG